MSLATFASRSLRCQIWSTPKSQRRSSSNLFRGWNQYFNWIVTGGLVCPIHLGEMTLSGAAVFSISYFGPQPQASKSRVVPTIYMQCCSTHFEHCILVCSASQLLSNIGDNVFVREVEIMYGVCVCVWHRYIGLCVGNVCRRSGGNSLFDVFRVVFQSQFEASVGG